MISVRVLFFASLREAVGDTPLIVDVEDGATVTELKVRLAETLTPEQGASLDEADVRIAINQNLIPEQDIRLAAGDEVAFMPPITGG